MDIRIYLNNEEHEYVKNQPEGFVRTLVQSAMQEKTPPKAPPIEVVKPKNFSDENLNICKSCGYMLPYYKAKCKNCGK